MKHFILCAILMAAGLPALAADGKKPLPPPPACVDPTTSTDYVPGVDAYGRPVASADVPGTADVEISTDIYAELRSQNRQLRRAGVDVRLKGLENLPLCAPVPILRIFSVEKAKEFYLGFLGFTVDLEHRFHDNAPLFMQVSRAGLKLYLSEHHGDGSPGVRVIVPMSGIDALHAELQAKKYRYINPGIEKMPWGVRQLAVIDPSGNHLIFSEDLPSAAS